MITLFDATVSRKPARRFGAGILASRPTFKADHTAADEAWLIADNARREEAARQFDQLVDEMFAESEAARLVESGPVL